MKGARSNRFLVTLAVGLLWVASVPRLDVYSHSHAGGELAHVHLDVPALEEEYDFLVDHPHDSAGHHLGGDNATAPQHGHGRSPGVGCDKQDDVGDSSSATLVAGDPRPGAHGHVQHSFMRGIPPASPQVIATLQLVSTPHASPIACRWRALFTCEARGPPSPQAV